MNFSTDLIACQLLDVVPVIMRTIRAEMRSYGSAELTVPLFRTLKYLDRHPGASLLDLAGHLGLTSPTAFKIVEGLVSKALVERADSPDDRRKITLKLTPAGQELLGNARDLTEARLVELLSALTESECEAVSKALDLLEPIFIYPDNRYKNLSEN
jgi:DNA-binding MarR family transcriptional regulator